jgi:hypothetical protein
MDDMVLCKAHSPPFFHRRHPPRLVIPSLSFRRVGEHQFNFWIVAELDQLEVWGDDWVKNQASQYTGFPSVFIAVFILIQWI